MAITYLPTKPPIGLDEIEDAFSATSLKDASNISGIPANNLSFLGSNNYFGPTLRSKVNFSQGNTAVSVEVDGTWIDVPVNVTHMSWRWYGSGCMPNTRWKLYSYPVYNTHHEYPALWNGGPTTEGSIDRSGNFDSGNVYRTEHNSFIGYSSHFWAPATRANRNVLTVQGLDGHTYTQSTTIYNRDGVQDYDTWYRLGIRQ